MEVPLEHRRAVLPDGVLATARALAASEVGISVGDASQPGFPLVHVNAAFERITGYQAEACLGRRCSFLQDELTDPAEVLRVREALAEGVEVTATLRNVRRDGQPFWNELRLVPVRQGGRLTHVLGFQLDVTSSIETARRLRAELDTATQTIAEQDVELVELRTLREALTPPSIVTLPGVELGVAFAPAEASVAGDFFLAAPGPEGTVTVAVGDVTGHGPQAAHRAAFVRASLVTFCRFTRDPQRLLELANASLIERDGDSSVFVTCACVNLCPRTGELAVASAGHHLPVRLERGAPVQASSGVPLVWTLDIGGATTGSRLGPGEGLLLYTDGVTEARRTASEGVELFGEGRLVAEVRGAAGASAQEVADRVRTAAEAFSTGPLTDDLCAVAVRRV